MPRKTSHNVADLVAGSLLWLSQRTMKTANLQAYPKKPYACASSRSQLTLTYVLCTSQDRFCLNSFTMERDRLQNIGSESCQQSLELP